MRIIPTQLLGMIGLLPLLLSSCDQATHSTTTDSQSTSQVDATTPRVTLKELMVGAVEPASNAIWSIALEENAPQSDADWQAIEHQVIQLLAATAATASGGTGPQDKPWAQQTEWQIISNQMASVGNDILTAVRARDYAAAVDASNLLVEPCGACHAAFPGESLVPINDQETTE